MVTASAGWCPSEVAVCQLDAAVGLAGDVGVMSDHQNGVAGGMQLVKKVEDDVFVGFIEISRWLIGKNQFWLIDQRAGDGHALLFAAGQLRGKMGEAIAHADAMQRLFGLSFIGAAVEILRQHHVFKRREIRHEMELLKDETNFFGAVADQLIFGEFGKIDIIDDHPAGGERVQPAKNIDQGGFAGAGRAHERHPFARLHAEADAVESAQRPVLLDQRFDNYLGRLPRGGIERAHASPRNTEAGEILARRRSG